MIKTVLFGTSKAANNFLANDTKEREYIVAVDNNSEQHGKEFHSMNIIGVDKLSAYEYDEIVVASFAGLEIKHQLLSLGVDESKIYLPQKYLLKSGIQYPFEDENTIVKARTITKMIASKAYNSNIPLHIDWGTLIGVLRDGDIIRWDDDIDFSSLLSYKKEVEEMINTLKEQIEKKLSCRLEILNTPTKLKLTCNADKQQFHSFEIDIDFKVIENKEAIQSGNRIWYTPSKHIEKLESFVWQGTELFIPSDADAYLSFVYGEWKTPKKNHSLDDYNHYKILT
jgi:hypothetical protein